MTLQGKKVLIILGGTWHDFDGFAECAPAARRSRLRR